ncbi:MAG: hypothetical protein ACRDS0_11490 [Pseudonocardiaceae bacterium]
MSSSSRAAEPAQKYSLIAGVAYLALGVIGAFRTGLSIGTEMPNDMMMNDMLFGISW